ncbi:hypothetical protein ElyMa_002669000 [Elysia marginata]|uniref:Uncharacterized protein n=1 Tax=Elysia marginata TaxID=1093978 RepID=A0AAV4HCL1_9GAST|nr:hypothetical protein ElyMa_002669000 [Elysia marginata]
MLSSSLAQDKAHSQAGLEAPRNRCHRRKATVSAFDESDNDDDGYYDNDDDDDNDGGDNEDDDDDDDNIDIKMLIVKKITMACGVYFYKSCR